ncbi:universal stress protein [Acinetobacter nectaris]|uniref:universal stress protein n=1 Tax=Acinetobacter nectaris TaxID=1219382 RepID=UPI001F2C8B28|nr:universal stress protein [Acinetobacter nectaris]MCF9034869.1 universal stress protein [Acinetobacter nectaris]
MKRVIACVDSSPCINAIAEAASWIAKRTQRELVLLQVLDYYPASYHLGEISGVIGFESNAMLLKELAELEEKQSTLAVDYSNNLLKHLITTIKEKHGIDASVIQEKGDFLEQSLGVLREDDIVLIGKVGESAAEKNKVLGSNVENFIRGANCTVMTVSDHFKPPTRFIFAYEDSPLCAQMLESVAENELFQQLQCHLLHVGTDAEVLKKPEAYLKEKGFDVVVATREGDVAQGIIDYQQEHGIQFVLLGAFSTNRISQFFLGSITTTVYRKIHVPIIVAK